MAQEELAKKVELAWLAAFYGGMLTEKQRRVLSMHCEEDLSLAEIADAEGISRQGVHDIIARSARRLYDMEAKLGVAARFRQMEEGLDRCRAALREKRYEDAGRALDALIRFDQEENNGL